MRCVSRWEPSLTIYSMMVDKNRVDKKSLRYITRYSRLSSKVLEKAIGMRSGIFRHVDALPNAGDDDETMRFIWTAAKGEAACKVARQFVSGIITFRVFAMSCARVRTHTHTHAQLIKSTPYGRPAAKRGFEFFNLSKKRLGNFSLAEDRCSMLVRRYSPSHPSRGWNGREYDLAATRYSTI